MRYKRYWKSFLYSLLLLLLMMMMLLLSRVSYCVVQAIFLPRPPKHWNNQLVQPHWLKDLILLQLCTLPRPPVGNLLCCMLFKEIKKRRRQRRTFESHKRTACTCHHPLRLPTPPKTALTPRGPERVEWRQNISIIWLLFVHGEILC